MNHAQGGSNNDEPEGSHWVDGLYAIVPLGFIIGYIWYYDPFSKTDFGNQSQEKFKFEIKRANDVD